MSEKNLSSSRIGRRAIRTLSSYTTGFLLRANELKEKQKRPGWTSFVFFVKPFNRLGRNQGLNFCIREQDCLEELAWRGKKNFSIGFQILRFQYFDKGPVCVAQFLFP